MSWPLSDQEMRSLTSVVAAVCRTQLALEMVLNGAYQRIAPVGERLSHEDIVYSCLMTAGNEGWLDQVLSRLVTDYPRRPEFTNMLAALNAPCAPAPSAALLPPGAIQSSRISRVHALHDELIRSLLRVRVNGLFVSNKGDANISATVSAVAALALNEAGDRYVADAQHTIKLLANRREKQGAAKGAWKAQSGSVCHVLATAWPLFAFARILPNELRSVEATVRWLASTARAKASGWGWHRGSPPKPFPTAYAVNALLAIKTCPQHKAFRPALVTEVDEAICAGVSHLIHAARTLDNRKLIYWTDNGNGGRLCLATTSICYHVLHKYITLDRGRTIDPQLGQAITTTFAAICESLGRQGLGSVDLEIPLASASVRASTWPVIHETDGINYTYSFFTPLLATTLVELFRDIEHSPCTPVLINACRRMVDWILDLQPWLADNNSGFLEVPGQSPSIWATAQSAIVLGRMTKVAELLQ